MMDCTNARLATKADNSSNLVTFRYVEIVCTFCGQNLIAFDDGITYVENYYLCMKFAAFIVAPNVDFVIFLPMFVRVRMLWQV